jgi:putative membrane protein
MGLRIEPGKRIMRGFFMRWIILTVAIVVSAYILDGIHVTGFFSAFFAAAILGVLNAFFRPILLILTLPINVLSLGLFTFVINALMLMMASGVISGLVVSGFGSALLGSLLISIVSWGLNSFVAERGRLDGERKDDAYIELEYREDQDRWE